MHRPLDRTARPAARYLALCGARWTCARLVHRGGLWNCVHFSEIAYRYPILGRGIYLIVGKMKEQFGHCALTVEKAEKVGYRSDPRYTA